MLFTSVLQYANLVKIKEVLKMDCQNQGNSNLLPVISQKALVPTNSSQNLIPNPQTNSPPINTTQPYMQPPPNYIQTPPYYYPYNFQNAGITLQQAQSLNFLIAKNQIELNKRYQEKLQDWTYALAIKELNKCEAILPTEITNNNALQNRIIDVEHSIKDFMAKYLLVKRRNKSQKFRTEFLIRNEELARHTPIEKKDLQFEFSEFLLSNVSIDSDIPQKIYERAWRKLQRSIPYLEKAPLDIIPSHQVVFLNGILDLKSAKFYPSKQEIFNDFSIPINWSFDDLPQIIFDEVLADMFNHDQTKITLAYEFIGAMMSSIPNLKKIYILQGVSNGGKSRLAKIILSLLPEEDIIELDTLSDITQDYVYKQLSQCRLIYIDETANKKILPTQASALKTIANGCGNAKILISTNHPLYTGENGFIEPALLNRFAVLPFENPMQNINPQVAAFEDIYLEQEKSFIIQKALCNFISVVQNQMTFSTEFPINAVTCQNNPQVFDATSQKLENTLSENYELTDDIVKETTAKSIFRDVSSKIPSTISNPAILGKKLKDVFGDDLKSQHLANGMAYNLRLKLNK